MSEAKGQDTSMSSIGGVIVKSKGGVLNEICKRDRCRQVRSCGIRTVGANVGSPWSSHGSNRPRWDG
jgi:hypothetical protein